MGVIDIVLTHGAIFVAEGDPQDPSPVRGGLVGMLAVIVLPHFITGALCAEEVCWWVEPRYRRRGLGPQLLGVATDWAGQEGATMLKMVAPAGSDVGRFYETVGFTAVETAYQKRL
jgi:GNAT superfamily N-acetyltransferase